MNLSGATRKVVRERFVKGSQKVRRLMANQIKHFYEFGSVRVDATNRLLYKDGEQLSLQPRVIDTLVVLVKNARTVVDKDTLLTEVWPDVVVEEGGLKRNISILRKALGEHGQFIETFPKRGYRFNAEVKEEWIELAVNSPQAQGVGVVVQRRANLRISHEEEIDDSSDSHPAGYRGNTVTQVFRTRRARVLTAASVLVLLAALSLFWAVTKNLVSTAGAPIRSIAVLPFKNLTPRTGEEHFGIGIADALITRLSAIKSLNVRPTSAVLKFDNSEQDSIAAGKALDVDTVLEGSIYRVNDRMRVTARLVRVNNQLPIWSGQYDEKADDLLAIQNAIPQHIVSLLELNISGREREALAKRHTENSDAYKLYLEGRFHWNKRTPEGMRAAERLFRKAMETDPNFALAYLGLADTLSMGDDAVEPDFAIDKAIRLDNTLGEAYASRGFTRAMNRWQWSEAEKDLKRAIELSPGYGTAHQWYATLLAITGRVEEAKTQMRQALAIDPMSYNFLADMGQMHYFAREYDQAELYCKKALEIQPEFVFALAYLQGIYLKKGEDDKVLDPYLRLHRAMYQSAAYSNVEIIDKQLAELREIYVHSGYQGLLRHEISNTSQTTPNNGYKYSLFVTHAKLGEKEKALEWLEKSYESHNFMLPFANADPMFDNLRTEPRFQAVLRKMNLAGQ